MATVTAAQAQRMTGRAVKMTLRGEYGVTLRWGVLREVAGGQLVIDGYGDCAGVGAYLPGRGCNVTEGVPVGLAEVVRLEVDHYAESKRAR